MSKITFELEEEQVDSIVIQELQRSLELFEKDIEERSNDTGLAIFDHDPVKDVLYIQEHVSALKLILEYYGVSYAS